MEKYVVQVSHDGEIILPEDVRKELNICEGDSLEVLTDETTDQFALQKI